MQFLRPTLSPRGKNSAVRSARLVSRCRGADCFFRCLDKEREANWQQSAGTSWHYCCSQRDAWLAFLFPSLSRTHYISPTRDALSTESPKWILELATIKAASFCSQRIIFPHILGQAFHAAEIGIVILGRYLMLFFRPPEFSLPRLCSNCLSLPPGAGRRGGFRGGGRRRHPGREAAVGQGDGQEARGRVLSWRLPDGRHGLGAEGPAHGRGGQGAARRQTQVKCLPKPALQKWL